MSSTLVPLLYEQGIPYTFYDYFFHFYLRARELQGWQQGEGVEIGVYYESTGQFVLSLWLYCSMFCVWWRTCRFCMPTRHLVGKFGKTNMHQDVLYTGTRHLRRCGESHTARIMWKEGGLVLLWNAPFQTHIQMLIVYEVCVFRGGVEEEGQEG